MAGNSRQSRMSTKDENFTFSWKLFTDWDYMIGNKETATTKHASLVTTFRVSKLHPLLFTCSSVMFLSLSLSLSLCLSDPQKSQLVSSSSLSVFVSFLCFFLSFLPSYLPFFHAFDFRIYFHIFDSHFLYILLAFFSMHAHTHCSMICVL